MLCASFLKGRAALISGIESVTLGVRDIDAVLALLRDVCGMAVESDTRASVSLLALWGLRPHEDVRLVELSCAGYAFGRIRLAAFPMPLNRRTRSDAGNDAVDAPTDVGPKALDLYVSPPLAAAAQALTAAGCRPYGGPARFHVRDMDTEEVMLSGPEDVSLLLMVGHRHPPHAQREPPQGARTSEVATVSVVTADLAATRRFYVEGLGLAADGIDDRISGTAARDVRRLFGVVDPGDVSLVMLRDPEQPSGKILAVQFHGAAERPLQSPMRPGNLGIALFSTRCPGLETLRDRLTAAGQTEYLPILHVALGDGIPARVMLARGPNGELFEFIER
jgi:catechol 2,3-dioxygenase-like lactoylglutathione lyase family enzyme